MLDQNSLKSLVSVNGFTHKERLSLGGIAKFLSQLATRDALWLTTNLNSDLLAVIARAIGTDSSLWQLINERLRRGEGKGASRLTLGKVQNFADKQNALPPVTAKKIFSKTKPIVKFEKNYSMALLNRLQAYELMLVPGISPELATRIVRSRDNRPFKDAKDLFERIPEIKLDGFSALESFRVV